MALCATTALAGAVSRLCVRGAHGRFGGVRAGSWCCVSPSSPFPPRVFRAACGGPSRPGVPYPRSLVRHSMRSVRSARSVRLPFWWSPRVLFVCVRSRSRGVRSPLGGVARASRVVPALGAGRAVPCGPCPSACLAPVPCSVWRAWGGAVRSRFPPTWLGVVGAAAGRPRGGAFVRCVGRSGSCAPLPSTARPLGGLSGSALWARACGCGGPALFRPAGSGHRESASAHTRKGHAGTTRRATGPSAWNAQTAWNGVPASEDKGHPDGTARHTQRGTCGAGRGKKGKHNTRNRPEPPRTGRERRAHTDGTLHPPRQ